MIAPLELSIFPGVTTAFGEGFRGQVCRA